MIQACNIADIEFLVDVSPIVTIIILLRSVA